MPPRIKCAVSRTVAAPFQRQQRQSRPISSITPQASCFRLLAVPARPELQAAAPIARRGYATAASPITLHQGRLQLPADYVPPTQPPSARQPQFRKSQQLRVYTALLRSSPLILLFQHNNLNTLEWTAIRRELRAALANVPISASASSAEEGASPDELVQRIELQVIRTRIFDRALKIVEFYDPAGVPEPESGKKYTHDLSKAAFDAVQAVDLDSLPPDSQYVQLAPLLTGPIALLTFPVVSPDHLAAALSILSPSPPGFPAPTRKNRPGYHDPVTQSGLQKLLLIGGRVEDRVVDMDGVKWVGGIEGGRDSLRAQLVHVLQSAGMGLTSTLEGAGKSLWLTMEGRRTMLDDEAKGPEEKKEPGS